MTVLIVDDDPINLKLLRAQLEAEGLTVLEAADGVEALEVLKQNRIDAIISDILMPRMDGYRFCYEVRGDPKLAVLPFIFYTNTYTAPADEELGLKTGADKFLRKMGSPDQILAAIHEVTARKKTPPRPIGPPEGLALMKNYSERLVAKLEEKNLELQATHAQLQQLLAHSPAVIYTLKLEGQKITPMVVSDNIERLLGVTIAESARYDWWLESLHPEERDRILAVVAEGLKQDGYSTEYRVRHKDGTYRWVEDNNRVVRDAAGQPKEAVGVWTDISERKKLEAEMALREQQFNSFFSGAAAGLGILDKELRYVQINDALAEMNGVPAKEHLGRTVQEVLPKLASAAVPLLQKVLDTGEPVLNGELSGETPREPGVQRHWIRSVFPIAEMDGRPQGVGVIVVEVTERKRAEETLKQRAAELERFHRLSVGRELQMIELKKEVNGLAKQAGRTPPYDLSFLTNPPESQSSP